MPPRGHAGSFPFRSWRLWYGVVPARAPSTKAPLVCVPGGPGFPHDAMERLVRFVPPDRSIVFYDPSGSGASDRPDAVHWDLALFTDELAALRDALALDRVHLLGSSVGGLISLGHALDARGVESITIISGYGSVPAARAAIAAQLATLPEDIQRGLARRDAPEFRAAYDAYVKTCMCRVPFPAELQRAMARANMPAYMTMKGLIGFEGTLRDVDLTPRLAAISCPVLLAVGRYDALYGDVTTATAAALPQARTMVFEHSAHMPHYEEPERFAAALFHFLDEVEPA